MSAIKRTILFAFFIWKAAGSCAAVPQGLLFLGKPVDSLCFAHLERGVNQIHLRYCGVTQEQKILKTQKETLLQQGFVGFEWKDSKIASPLQGYSYYKVFNAGDHQFWIFSLNHGGGTGEFTAVSLGKRKNKDRLEVTTIVGGDRCNGGIQDVKEKKAHLFFSVNLTAYDFFSLANENPHHLKAYDDLAACATCCVAKAFYEVNADLKLKLNYVNLNREFVRPSVMPQQGAYQPCFNTLFASAIAKNRFTLTISKIKSWAKEFNNICKKV